GLLVLVGMPLVAGEKPSLDPEKLVGKWQYVSGEKSGEKVDLKMIKDQAITVTKDTWTLQGKDVKEKFVMKYELNTKKSPATIKLTMTESPFGAGAVSHGIVEVKGDELRLCYATEGDTAPKEFKTKEGDKNHLFVMKRVK